MTPTDQISIRRAEPADFEAVTRIHACPRVIWGTFALPFPSAEQWRKRFAEPTEGFYHLLACAGNEVVGHLGLQTYPNQPRRRHVGYIGMAVRDDWQGKGVGTKLMLATLDLADKWLSLTRLELQVYTDNEPGIKLYQRMGFVVEGTLKRFAFRDGQYVDALQMARVDA